MFNGFAVLRKQAASSSNGAAHEGVAVGERFMTDLAVADLSHIPVSQGLSATLARASQGARASGAAEVSLEHVLAALCDDAEAADVLAACNIDAARLKADVIAFLVQQQANAAPHGGNVMVSVGLMRILEAAAAAARGGRKRDINGAIVLAAIVGDGRSTAAQILQSHGLTFEGAIRALQSAMAQPRPVEMPPAEDVLARARERVQSRSAPSLREIMLDKPNALPAPKAQPDDIIAPPPASREPAFPHPGEPNAAPVPSPVRAALPPEQPADTPSAQPAPAPPNEDMAPSAAAAAPAVILAPPEPVATQPESGFAPVESPVPATSVQLDAPPSEIAVPPPAPAFPPPAAAPAPPAPAAMPPLPPPAGFAPAPMPGAPGNFQPEFQPHLGPPGAFLPPPYPPPVSAAPPPPPFERPRTGPQPPPIPPPVPPLASARGPQPPPYGYGVPPAVRAHHGPIPPPASEPPRAPVPAAKRSPRPQSELGQLSENIPRSMRAGVSERVEVRIARPHVPHLTEGIDGTGQSWRHEIAVTNAMSVRIRAPEGGFFIETASPETQWIDSQFPVVTDDFASWRFQITPQRRGMAHLQIIVSARSVGPDGLAAETAFPDQVVQVKVRTNYRRALAKGVGWIAAAIAGGALAKFGEGAIDAGQGLLSRLMG